MFNVKQWSALENRDRRCLIAVTMGSPEFSYKAIRADFGSFRQIADKAEGRGGLLIIDESQNIGEAARLNGLKIVNGLRYFVDKKVFGIAFLSNGEIYRRVVSNQHGQLSSRMEAWRVEIKDVPDEDVDSIMTAWGVSGKHERNWCLAKAKGKGGLRALTNDFRKAKREFGEINFNTLNALGRI